MEMKRDIRVEKKKKKNEEDNMCTSLLTAVLVLSMTCLKHFSSVSYLIKQWRSLVFLLLNIILLTLYFTSTHPISHDESHDFKTRRGRRLRMMRVKKKKKSLEVEPKEVIKNCIVEETKRITVKDYVSMDFNGEEDEFEQGRLSNEELNERVEAFITTFRQHLVIDARRGKYRETDQKIISV